MHLAGSLRAEGKGATDTRDVDLYAIIRQPMLASIARFDNASRGSSDMHVKKPIRTAHEKLKAF